MLSHRWQEDTRDNWYILDTSGGGGGGIAYVKLVGRLLCITLTHHPLPPTPQKKKKKLDTPFFPFSEIW